ncbi:MAG: AI-2E family transporter [Alphaproteobacteria bacterium]|nr:AI-2E family transporter [Alphaproteobacteria bacterium]
MYKNISGLQPNFLNGKLLFAISGFLLCGLFFYLFSGICFPFVVGFVLAYLCEPLASACERYVNRTLLSLVLALCSIFLFIFIGYKILPYIKDYIELLSNNAPIYYERFMSFLDKSFASMNITEYRPELADFKVEIQKYFDQKIYILASVIKEVALKSNSITGFFSFFVIMPISFFYFLKDWNMLVNNVYKCIPNRQKSTVTEAFMIIRKTFTDFFHGQFYVVAVLSLYYAFFLGLIDISEWISLGIISGLFSFIPFIGALISFVLVLFVNVAILNAPKIYFILGIYLIGQFVEGYVLSPKFVGEKTGLHPLWILFSFFAGIQLLGILGVLIAIPLAAVIRNLIRFTVKKFKATQAYKQ